jgi:acetate kinase
MIVLALNCGSSSIKFAAYKFAAYDGERTPPVARGTVERLGERARLRFDGEGLLAVDESASVPGHAEGVRRIVEWIEAAGLRLHAVGHRVVHGGARFVESVRIDDEVIDAVEALEALAPLHNAPSLAGIRAARTRLGDLPMVAVFDTSFHARLPAHVSGYALPHELAARHAIRRYGFHGTSFRSVLARYAALSGRPAEQARLVALHLGHGCSAAAIVGGHSIDTSMGLTPLEGLVMGTRAGDLDPAIVDFLAGREAVTATEVTRWLNEGSGLRGVSGTSSDVRDLLARETSDARARLALEMFCYRARKYVGAYLAALGGADAVVFTGGIGENAPPIRERICRGMDWCGLVLDPERNAQAVGREARIGGEGGHIAVLVIPTDEERVIALDTVACLSARAA